MLLEGFIFLYKEFLKLIDIPYLLGSLVYSLLSPKDDALKTLGFC